MLPEDILVGKLRLPKGWTENVRGSFVQAISLGHTAITYARGFAANSQNVRLRQAAEIDRLKNEVYLLREELEILRTRFSRLPAEQRPRYTPKERFRILLLKAARQWSQATTAKHMLVNKQTVYLWMKCLTQEGKERFLEMPESITRFPDFVRSLVKQLRGLCPALGKRLTADILARASLHISASTVLRITNEKEQPSPEPSDLPVTEDTRIVTADHPNHVWHIDLTVVPTSMGFWVPWLPQALTQRFPFCYWLVPIVDHFSRQVLGIGVFLKQPNSKEICALLDKVIAIVGQIPKHIISDQGKQFRRRYKRWCRDPRRKINPRFGALYKHGSIAVVERFNRTLKDYCRTLLVSYNIQSFVREVNLHAIWYNEHRPHSFLNGQTPNEVCFDLPPKNKMPRLEPRLLYPIHSPCAAPQAPVRGSPGARVELCVSYLEGRRGLPIIEVREAA